VASTDSIAGEGAQDGALAATNRVFAKVAWQIVPAMVVLYIAAYLDRVNIGFAALTMNRDLGLSPEVFGFGAGIFFFGYFLFEVPANVILERVGARRWICRIMVSWGAVSMATAFASGALSFYALRFLLGLAEAGFFPGMILYLTYWFPRPVQARLISLFLAALPLANILGGPASTAILEMNGIAGLYGWQWLFLLEGVPSVVFGIAVLWWLPDGPRAAAWLQPEERDVIAASLAAEAKRDHVALLPMLADPRVWLLTVPDFLIVLALYGVNLWLPQIVKGLGFSDLETGFVTAAPYVVCMAAMVVWGISSDKYGERIWHTVVAALLGAAGLAAAAVWHAPLAMLIALTVAIVGIYAALAVFWTLPPSFLGGTAAAGGIALINSVANLGGFFGPAIMGWLREHTGGFGAGMAVLSGAMLLAAVLVVLVGWRVVPPSP